jgi:Gluconate 2-dehydrogenase subunit 3
MSEDFKRRDLFRISAGGLLLAKTGTADAPTFFAKEEYAAVEELMETLIPSDDHSPGAKAAGCAAYWDKRLTETQDAGEKQRWHDGVKSLEALSQKMFGKSIAQAAPQERGQLMEAICKNELHPKTPEEKFFNNLKAGTAFAYYTSDIGIHKEMGYKGNVYLKEFVGVEPT